MDANTTPPVADRLTGVRDGDDTGASTNGGCEYLESFEDGLCGDDANMVTIGGVSVTLCPAHESVVRAEHGSPDGRVEAR